MSLLLDALRRASASREDPKGEHYTVPRRATEPAHAPEPGVAPETDDALALTPRDDGSELPLAEAAPSPGPDSAEDDPSLRPLPRERATADALLQAGGDGTRRGRFALALGLLLAGAIAAAALAGGGWLWYQQSRDQIASELGRFQPAPAPDEPAGPPEAPEQADAPSIPALADAIPQSPPASAEADEAADAGATATAPFSEDPAQAGEGAPAQASAPSENADGDSSAEEEGAPAAPEPTQAEPSTAGAPAGGDASAAPDGPSATKTADATDATDAADAVDAVDAVDAADAADAAHAADTADAAASRDAPAAERDTRGQAAHETPSVSGAESGGTAEPAAPAQDADGANATPRRARPLIQVARGAPLAEALRIGYGALRDADLATAETAYERALDLAPDNRDALLGAAVVRQRQNSPEAAQRLYQRVLDAHPRDPYARAAMAALDGRATRRNESELKMLLRDDPAAPALNFALGNLYAGESRWAEARQAYARASDAVPADPDYAFNLAVALDHLGQREAAHAQYRRALRLSANGAPEFEPAAVRTRLQQLR